MLVGHRVSPLPMAGATGRGETPISMAWNLWALRGGEVRWVQLHVRPRQRGHSQQAALLSPLDMPRLPVVALLIMPYRLDGASEGKGRGCLATGVVVVVVMLCALGAVDDLRWRLPFGYPAIDCPRLVSGTVPRFPGLMRFRLLLVAWHRVLCAAIGLHVGCYENLVARVLSARAARKYGFGTLGVGLAEVRDRTAVLCLKQG
ncbi:hypothetical protein B0J12DRAFT_447574 [Macrophomina phaseolina]|uniref:Uncharacterized protein n=1 Tax=Macrophomina phaseolina TaxID=35725 RepID=A0ABQ8GF09_9PEZI|nr:hypothetical protein B0J12DRAFT_447574 [Macrophomina phaseolina]